MSVIRDHDVEAGEASDDASELGDGPPGTKTHNLLHNILWNIAKFIYGSEHGKADRKPIPDDLGLTTMTRILRNMVAANDLDGVTDIIAQMQGHEKSEGFTIQDVAGNGLLQIAALNDFHKMTKLLLKMGFDINYVDDNHGTALQAAIYMDSEKVLKVLLHKNRNPPVNVNTVGGYYGCALQVAAFKGSLELINKLADRGVNEDVFIAKSKYGTALQAAARTGLPFILKRILELKSVQVNAEGGAWGTALQAAAKGEYTEATAQLRQLSRGRVLSQVNKVPRKKVTEKEDYLEVARILLEEGAKVDMREGGRLRTPINAAASSGQPKMLNLLLDSDDSPKEEREKKYGRALLSAITQSFNTDRMPLVRALILGGADINFVAGNCLLNTPLAAAAAMNDKNVVEHLLEASGENRQKFMDAESGIYGSALRAALSAPQPAKDAALYLISQGADIRNGDQSYGNILHLAAFANLPEIVSVLLKEYNVEVDALDKNNQTALHIAAYRGYEQVVKILLDAGADASLKDVWGDNPLIIVGDVIGRESHPVPSLQGLRKIREMLLKNSMSEDPQLASLPFQGPVLAKQQHPPEPEHQKAKPVFESPKWNPGLKFYAKIVDFLEHKEKEHVLIKDLAIDDLLYKERALAETMAKEDKYKLKLRWIHLPTNNMTWAEMLIKILWPEEYKNSTCKSIWGTDPYFVSPDLAPHARFVTPQCGRLIQEFPGESSLPQRSSCEGTLFFAMPYIHWESYSSQVEVGEILDEIKEGISKTRIWRPIAEQTNKNPSRQSTGDVNEPPHLQGGDDGQPGAINTKSTDYDGELLKTYLYKRWPVHMRRTLDQYYYSYLADTKTRDGDQVAMRARDRKLREEAQFSAQYVTTDIEKEGTQKDKKKSTKKDEKEPTQKDKKKSESKSEGKRTNDPPPPKDRSPKPDGNSPVVMVDQLWLWVVSPNLVITSFPRRRSVKQDGDLDPEDKTDVLKTLLDYLRSTKRGPIKDAYDVCELVVSQTVGILHRSDMIPELDFLKIFATQADWAIDQVMTGLRDFVDKYKVFMKWLNGKQKDPSEYVRRFEKIFSVTNETELLREIQDMKDELNMLSAVFRDQNIVLEKVGQNIDMSRALLSKACGNKESGQKESQEKVSENIDMSDTLLSKACGDKDSGQKELQEKVSENIDMICALLSKAFGDKQSDQKASLESTSAFIFQQQSEKHAAHIKRMQAQANQAYRNLQDLLNFKQQQANVLEARVNRNQSITAKEQGKTIMVFTIVTIIFLPLTFMTTVFTVPLLDFPRYDPTSLQPSPVGNLKGNFVFSIVVGSTLLIAIPLVFIAFKIRRLQSGWDRMKEVRKRVFPLHMKGMNGRPDAEEGDPPISWENKFFYWGGPSPRRDEKPVEF